MTDEQEQDAKPKEKPAEKPNDPFAHVPTVAQPVSDPDAERTDEGREIHRDEHGRAFTVSSPQTGGIRTYLDEEEFPPEMPEGEDFPPALKVVPPQAAAGAASEFDPAPALRVAPEAPVLQTSAPEEHKAAAPVSGVPSFSATQVTAAQASTRDNAPKSAAAQAVIDATLAHPAAQPVEREKGGSE